MPTLGAQLAALAVTDTLKHAALPASFTKLPWAEGSGTWSEASGWKPTSFSESFKANSRSGIYLNTEEKVPGQGVILYIGAQSPAAKRSFSIWMFSAAGANPSGYQLEAVVETEGETRYALKLWKWVEGVGTLLKEQNSTPLQNAENAAIALVGIEGKVIGFYKGNTASPFATAWEVAETTFTKGFSGIAGNGSNPSFVNFSSGLIVPESKEFIIPNHPHRGLIMSGGRRI